MSNFLNGRQSAAVLVHGPECSICNARLVQICYQRSSPFRVAREESDRCHALAGPLARDRRTS